MTNVLIVTWDGGGNLPPALAIGRELQRRGVGVRVLGHAIQREAVARAGLPFTAFTRGRDYVSARPRGTIDGVLGLAGLFADRGIADDVRALIDGAPVDTVIVDCLLWGATQQLGADGVRVVSLVHSVGAFFGKNARGPLGLIARLRGTNPVAAERAAALTLVTTRDDFEPDPRNRGVHTGFVWQDQPFESRPSRVPRVLVSFSTTSFPGQAAALQRALDALADESVEVVATTGAVDPTSLRVPANATVVRARDHAEVLPTTSLVIGHGGHATTARALTAGIPVLVLPMHPLMDQPAVGRAVERLGVGATLPKSASSQRIRAAALRLLDDPVVREAARRMGAEARARDGAVSAVDALLAADVPTAR
jgi:UDP:flavonoid glycosyltransferase YjiC (YdhE family)